MARQKPLFARQSSLRSKATPLRCACALRGFCQLGKTARYHSTCRALRRLPMVARHQSLLRWRTAKLTPIEAADLSKLVDGYRRAVETADLAACSVRLEQTKKK